VRGKRQPKMRMILGMPATPKGDLREAQSSALS
jgi:hypothetical protein